MASEGALGVRYVHTNLIARDWRALARFYVEALGCEPAPPERHLRGPWLDRLTGLSDAAADGVHLRLPGAGGITLEIFEYTPANAPGGLQGIDRTGLGHLAFHVDDVPAALCRLVEHGGSPLGEVVRMEIAGAGLLTVVYARDPEGNCIELQNWENTD